MPLCSTVAVYVFSRATAFNARRFLDAVVDVLPVALRSIQVDGGSRLMAEFEDACQRLGIELHVLPPRRPKWNGRVERASTEPPALDYLTPNEYIVAREAA